MNITATTTPREAFLIGIRAVAETQATKAAKASLEARKATPVPEDLLTERVRKGRKLNFVNKRAMTDFVVATLNNEQPHVTDLLRLPREVDQAYKRFEAIEKTANTIHSDIRESLQNLALESAFLPESDLKAKLDEFTAKEFFTDFEAMVTANLKPKKAKRVKKVKTEEPAPVENGEGEPVADVAPAPKLKKRAPKKDILG